ncbi:erythroblast NAD(P)(+)--arginine ADP-ribosyltransferase-like, partial [Neopelma chrysocephalum]|uniref:erythroblast NAD(P)(+)--arginine ADP-ribosyltransferase-like n=1 Tax=Neopelma chrysocephalum TaxID=114329 RepID=UPI000FCD3DE2
MVLLVALPVLGLLATGIYFLWWHLHIKVIPLDMAPNAFDDQYRGCREGMFKKLPELNRTEFAPNSEFTQAWAYANAKWQKQKYKGSLSWKEQAIALLAYTLETDLYKDFNRAVPKAGRSHQQYLRYFPFKMMHFLLTTALQDLRDALSHPRCLHVFRGVRGIRFTAQPGDIVRFGHFASSSLSKKEAKKFGTDTLFELDTCHGAKIQDFSFIPEEQEVLIPPFETFSVTSVTRQGAETHIQLSPLGKHSNYSCAFFSGDIPGVGTPVGAVGTGWGWHRLCWDR